MEPKSAVPLSLLLLGVLFSGGGCLVSSQSTVSYEDSRKPVSANAAKGIRIGVTTKQWILENLGPPTSMNDVGDGVEVLHYVSTEKKQGSLKLLLIGDFSGEKEGTETFYVTLKDGIVQDFGRRKL